MKTPPAALLIKTYGIGLTGNIACGKSAVMEIIRDLGYYSVDADQLARQIVAKDTPTYVKIINEFGREILTTSGEIDRKKLGAVVFGSADLRKKLEAITHPAIAMELQTQIAAYFDHHPPHLWFYEASLLFEAGRHEDFREIWVVSCDPEIQIQRLMARNGIDRESAQKRIAAQMPSKKKEALADVVIYNNGNKEELRMSVIQNLKDLENRTA